MALGRDGRKLGRTSPHRMALLNNLAVSLFRNERIVTTEQKAKELRRCVDGIITSAKKGGLPNIRRVNKKIRDKKVLKKIFDTIIPSVSGRQSGYTSIIKTGYRNGDRAKMVIIKLILSETAVEKNK